MDTSVTIKLTPEQYNLFQYVSSALDWGNEDLADTFIAGVIDQGEFFQVIEPGVYDVRGKYAPDVDTEAYPQCK